MMGKGGRVARRRLRANLPTSTPFSHLPPVLDYRGEFGAELVLFLPFCTWLSKVGLLKNRRISTYKGMRSFYEHLDVLEILEKDEPRRKLRPGRRLAYLPVKDEHSFDGVGRSPYHLYPDLRALFRRVPLEPDIDTPQRPLLIIHNKHADEWKRGPINYLPLEFLAQAFSTLKSRFTVVYVRHGMRGIQDGFSHDQGRVLPFEDRDLLQSHPEVLCFDDLFAAKNGSLDLNTFKNALYSRCHRFITSQGGGAHHIALFSGSLITVLHRQGFEWRLAYGDGYYGFMANPAPVRVVCQTHQQLSDSLSVFTGSEVIDNRIHIDPAHKELMLALSPWRPFVPQPMRRIRPARFAKPRIPAHPEKTRPVAEPEN